MILGRLMRLEKKAKIFFKVRKNTLVLMYHRIIEGPVDPWQLCVSPKNFEDQLEFLKSTGLVISMDQFKENMYSKKKMPPSILITFDDGYLDNYLNAKPLLEKFGLPATFFICTKHIGTQKEFWWDELAHLILESEVLPQTFDLELSGKKIHFDLKAEAILNDTLLKLNKDWNWQMPPTTLRVRLHLMIWQVLSSLAYGEQQQIMQQIRDWSNIPGHQKEENYCMSEAQLLDFFSNSLFTIGGHTQSHPVLPAFPREVQKQEISSNKSYLEALTGKLINTFAYPSGKFDDITIDEVRNSGFEFGFTTIFKPLKIEDDKFRLGRVQIIDLNKNEFRKKMERLLI